MTLKVNPMTDCPRCRIKYSSGSNKRGRSIGSVILVYCGWRGRRVRIVDICYLCGGSGRVLLSRAYPSSSRMRKETMKLYKKQQFELQNWEDMQKDLLGIRP